MDKKRESSKEITNVSKSETPFKTARDMLSWNTVNYSEKLINKICEDVLEWSRRDDAEDMLSFFRIYGIPRQKYYFLKKRNDNLSQVHEIVLDNIGERLQKKARYKDFNWDNKAVIPVLKIYHPDWRQVWEEDQEAQAKLNEAVEIHMKTYHDQNNKPG